MTSEQALKALIDSIQAEQDELTLQKNYLSEASQILSGETLHDSFEALINCMQDYPAYLFKKEKEFIFFFTKLNTLMNIPSDDVTDFSDPNIKITVNDIQLKMSFYYTVQGICEINFDYNNKDAAIQVKFDALNRQAIVSSQDVLNLSLPSKAKSSVIHYVADLMKWLKTINFDIQYENSTNIDPFLMFKHFEFERAPRLDDSDLDRLFITMDGKGDMRYTDDNHGVILTLDDQNTVWVKTTPGSLTSTVTMENSQQEIYLFDLLGENPFLEMLFSGEIRIKKSKKSTDGENAVVHNEASQEEVKDIHTRMERRHEEIKEDAQPQSMIEADLNTESVEK